jgi:hypothetical protein
VSYRISSLSSLVARKLGRLSSKLVLDLVDKVLREAFVPAGGIWIRSRFARGQRFVGISSVLLLVYRLVYAAYRTVEAGLTEDGCDNVVLEGLDCAKNPPMRGHFGGDRRC